MAKPQTKPQKRGRPTVGERIPLGLRVTPDLKAQLDRAATASGRSQSQEAELRLESTFKAGQAVYDALDLAYGRRLTGILLAAVNAAQLTGTRAVSLSQWNFYGGEEWVLDPYAYDQAVKAINFILEAFRPKGEIALPPDSLRLPQDAYERMGEGFAREMIGAVENTSSKMIRQEIAKPIQERLADLLAHTRLEPDEPLSKKP